MHIIAKRTLRLFWQSHPQSETSLLRWHTLVQKSRFDNFAELRRVFPHADQVGELTVFNIGGNKFRLIVSIAYRSQTVFIKHVLTHAEYDKGAWKK